MTDFEDVTTKSTSNKTPVCLRFLNIHEEYLQYVVQDQKKTITLNLINRHRSIDKIYLYAKESYKPRYQLPTQLSEELEEELSSASSEILVEITSKRQKSKPFPHKKYYPGFSLL